MDCTNSTGDCNVTMNAARNVTSTFNQNKVMLDSNYHGTLASAYTAASEGKTIKAQAITLIEDLMFNSGFGFILQGGYDSSFGTHTDYTTVQGKVTLGGTGKVIVDRVIIK